MHHLAHRFRRDLSLVRTAECGRDVSPNADPLLARAGDDRAETLDRLVDAGVDVALVERLRRRGEHRDLAHAGRDGALEAAQVGDERRIADAARAVDAAEDLLGVGELRNRRL